MRVTDDQSKSASAWRPQWWVRFTTMFAYAWGVGVATLEVTRDGRAEVLFFCGAIIVLGMGLSGAVSLFKR